jgi:broad specificity phosphatase PhoE
MRLYLVRHGYSEANEKPELYQQTMQDIGLLPLGKVQAQESGKLFAELLKQQGNTSPLRVFCSPFKRTRQTRDIFIQQADSKGHPLLARIEGGMKGATRELNDDIGERNQGDFAGIGPNSYADIRSGKKNILSGEVMRPYNAARDEPYMATREGGNTYDAKPPKGENGKELCDRVRRFVEQEKLRAGGMDAVLFAHANSIDALISVLTTTDEAGCKRTYNEIMKDPKHVTGNAEIVMLEDSKEHPGLFTATKLAIKPPQSLENAPPLTTQALPQTERNYQHLTDFGMRPSLLERTMKALQQKKEAPAKGA